MATAFNTQTGNGEYRLQFETNNKDHFLLMQATARQCIDGKPQANADRIRAMSDEDLACWIMCPYDSPYCDGIEHNCIECTKEWLKQPAEVSGDA